MKEIKTNLIENITEFELVCLPISCYQKKNGSVPMPNDGILSIINSKIEDFDKKIGETIEQFGSCPSIFHTLIGTKFPTKFATFPIAPTSLRVRVADDFVVSKLKGRFKKEYVLLPGWMLAPRPDSLEFSCIKLKEIMKWYKLTKVAIPWNLFNIGEGDEEHIERTRKTLEKFLNDSIYLVYHEDGNSLKESKQNIVVSQVERE